MSLDMHKESAWAFRELMKAAQRDIDEGGEIKPARPMKPTVKYRWPLRFERKQEQRA